MKKSAATGNARKEKAARLRHALTIRKSWSPEQIAIEEAALKREIAARLSAMNDTKSENENENTDV